jgi:hypothetical protein
MVKKSTFYEKVSIGNRVPYRSELIRKDGKGTFYEKVPA